MSIVMSERCEMLVNFHIKDLYITFIVDHIR
jgi:hypothetical protein